MKRDRIVGAGVSLLAAAAAVWAFAPVLAGGVLTRMDDDVYMAMAQKFGGLTPAGVGWALTETEPYYHPLPRLTHLLAYSLFGFWMAGHHAVNLVLHAGNAALVAALAWVLFAAWPVGQRAAAAGVAGVVFAVHPLQAESVAWLAGRTQLVCGTLMLGCALAYVRVAGGRGRWRWLPGALFALGWLAKPIVVTMPLVLLVLDWFPLGRYRAVGWKTLLGEKAWMFALGGVLTVWTFRFAPEQLVYTTADLDVWQRGLLAARASVFYLWKLVWPAWLSPFYPLVGEIRLAMPEFFVSVGVVAMMCAGAWWARRRCAVWTAAWLAYLALLLPVSGLTQFGTQSVANRHAYVAMVPLLLAVAGGATWAYRSAPVAGRIALVVFGVAVAGSLAGKTRGVSRMWHDDETLWRNVLRWYPDFVVANWKVAVAEASRHDFAAALPHVERVLEERPYDCEVRGLAGLVYLKTGQYPAAVRTLEPLAHTNVWLPAARYNLACAYARLGSNEAAVAVLRELIACEPRFAGYAQRDGEFAAIREWPEFVEAVRVRPPS
jgi:hypothetical protein